MAIKLIGNSVSLLRMCVCVSIIWLRSCICHHFGNLLIKYYREKKLIIYFYFLLKVFIKYELKVGVIYVKEGQYTEEEILDNNDNSPLFEEFLQVLGEKFRLKGFDKYKGGLDTVHDLTGKNLKYIGRFSKVF